MAETRYFGIRHHGPGCAGSLLRALQQWRPQLVLIEGPSDAEVAEILPLAADAGMKPPVAFYVYRPDQPGRHSHYPFAEFSPEWVALRHCAGSAVPVRFIDLPMCHQLADPPEPKAEAEPVLPPAEEPEGAEAAQAVEDEEEDAPRGDGIAALARIAGYDDAERWWSQLIEHRVSDEAVFEAIAEGMRGLREQEGPLPKREALREAWMRQKLREAQKDAARDGIERIAVICGAWHVPALEKLPPAKHDADLLKGLPKAKIAAGWTPWTHGRLAQASGYGAGVTAPGWYLHLWRHRDKDPRALTIRWLVRFARRLRREDLEASGAHVIEAVRLAEALAAMRARHLPDLVDLDESLEAVFGGGAGAKLGIARRGLWIDEKLGEIPEHAPLTALARDLAQQQKSLRLPPEPEEKLLTLDLRKDLDRGRSVLLHRLTALGIAWGHLAEARGRGTFKEAWNLAWQPEFTVRLVESAALGTTVEQAAQSHLVARCAPAAGLDLAQLAGVVETALRCEMAQAVQAALRAVDAAGAASQDVPLMLRALPPLAAVARYGDVRGTDAEQVAAAARTLATRACAGLVQAASQLDEDASRALLKDIDAARSAIDLLREEALSQLWLEALARTLDGGAVYALLSGALCRFLYEAKRLDGAAAAQRLALAGSAGADLENAAAWIEGFVGGSGLALLHDAHLLPAIDGWVRQLDGENFQRVLPLLRRAFSGFAAAERRQIGERLRQGAGGTTAAVATDYDPARTALVLPMLKLLLETAP